MENDTFTSLCAELTAHFGASSPLDSGTGVRFKSSQKGKATVYHAGIATGNQSEIAFEVESMANRLQMSEGEFRSFITQLRASTGRPVEINAQYNWPRVGLASQLHVTLVAGAIKQHLTNHS